MFLDARRSDRSENVPASASSASERVSRSQWRFLRVINLVIARDGGYKAHGIHALQAFPSPSLSITSPCPLRFFLHHVEPRECDWRAQGK